MPGSIELADVVELAAKLEREYPVWRRGQSAFNALALLAQPLADSIRGTDLDPFHKDDRLDAFWTHVGENLGGQL
jgi:hypothetical protein